MQCARLDRERFDVADMGNPQTVFADRLDVFRPWIDVGDVFTGLYHMGPGITPDRPRADDRYLLLRHSVFLRIWVAAQRAACSVHDPSTAQAPASPHRFTLPLRRNGFARARIAAGRRGGAALLGLAARFTRPSRRF